MKLQTLELFGFKSFADRVAIEFNPGITAIVGPNGCGKSNISDAIRWVLGEQRPTLVRGASMQEVIFAGSRERKPINLAEVTLRFSNDDGTLPVEWSEVAVTRRAFRDDQGEYLLNKRACRLKDVQDLFLGTGVGAHGYSLIQQGMVDSVLSDKTEERRALFEEAAGVTRYKSRRKAAERKLEATRHDLERVEDIVSEVEKAVASLRRQVGKTRRYRDYLAEETRLDLHAGAAELAALAAREEPLAAELRALEEAEAAQAARLGELEAALETLELALVQGRETERVARERAETIRRSIGRREESRLVTGESIRHAGERLRDLAAEDERGVAALAGTAERRASLEEERAGVAARLAQVVERLASTGADDESRAGELRAERAALAADLESLRERLAEAKHAAARQASLAEGATERLAALEQALAAAREEREAAAAAAGSARAALEGTGERRAAAAEAAGTAREEARAAGAAVAAAREALAAARAAERAAATRHETLAAMEARFEGYARGVRALLEAGAVEGLAGALPQALEPAEPRFEAPLERYLESLGHGLLARDRGAALAAAERLDAGEGGGVDFLVPELLAVGPAPEIPDAAAAVVLARGPAALRWTGDPALEGALAPLFERLLVVADRAAAFRCRDALDAAPEAARHYVVAGLDGTLIEPTGRWRTGGGGDDEAHGLLARRRRLAEAEAETAARAAEAADRARGTAGAEGALATAEEARAAAEAAAAEAEGAWGAAREALAVAEETALHAERRLAELEGQILEQAEARRRALGAEGALGETVGRLDADVARLRDRHEGVRAALERSEADRIDRQSARHAVELERTQAEAELRAVEREIEHAEQAARAIAAARGERAAERVRLEESIERLEAERAATAAEIEGLHGSLDAADREVRAEETRRREGEERRAALETELKGLRRAHDETVERRHAATLARQDVRFRRDALQAHVAETYDGALEDLVAAHPLVEDEADLPLESLRERLDEVRRKRANLGPVNMLAVEEFDRESERLAFLAGQRDDLVQARRQLEDAIRKINATARELFRETFEAVAGNFEATFRTLFEGGHARVVLTDPEDPLESPIEIVASPRGKRVQHISLLSGGERALTALALLFAIYQVKPSPFCILDEVDAPLDDANVGRFLTMIRHFSDRTQFIVITHNKRTMEAADWLYGITMEEPGVSTLVSVALDDGPPRKGRREEPAAVHEANGHEANGHQANGHANGGANGAISAADLDEEVEAELEAVGVGEPEA